MDDWLATGGEGWLGRAQRLAVRTLQPLLPNIGAWLGVAPSQAAMAPPAPPPPDWAGSADRNVRSREL